MSELETCPVEPVKFYLNTDDFRSNFIERYFKLQNTCSSSRYIEIAVSELEDYEETYRPTKRKRVNFTAIT